MVVEQAPNPIILAPEQGHIMITSGLNIQPLEVSKLLVDLHSNNVLHDILHGAPLRPFVRNDLVSEICSQSPHTERIMILNGNTFDLTSLNKVTSEDFSRDLHKLIQVLKTNGNDLKIIAGETDRFEYWPETSREELVTAGILVKGPLTIYDQAQDIRYDISSVHTGLTSPLIHKAGEQLKIFFNPQMDIRPLAGHIAIKNGPATTIDRSCGTITLGPRDKHDKTVDRIMITPGFLATDRVNLNKKVYIKSAINAISNPLCITPLDKACAQLTEPIPGMNPGLDISGELAKRKGRKEPKSGRIQTALTSFLKSLQSRDFWPTRKPSKPLPSVFSEALPN